MNAQDASSRGNSIPVRLRSVAHMFLETVSRVLPTETHHHAVTRNLCNNGRRCD